MRTPDFYPAAFHSALMAGGAVLLAENLPWSLRSSRNRFYGFLAALRAAPSHPLHHHAFQSWSAERTEAALIIRPYERRERGQLGADAAQVLKTLLDKGGTGV